MISPATYYRIQHEFHEEHRKLRDIARRLGLANQTVSKWASRPAYTRRTTCRQAIIHNSDYQSVEECKKAIDRYFEERNQHFKEHPMRAGKKIWGEERVLPIFSESNNCKDPRYQNRTH
jgi:hypothetical protein